MTMKLESCQCLDEGTKASVLTHCNESQGTQYCLGSSTKVALLITRKRHDLRATGIQEHLAHSHPWKE